MSAAGRGPARPLRVAFVDYILEPARPGRSGLSDMVWDMASELADAGHQPHVVASYRTHAYPDPRVTVHNFPEPVIGYRNLLGQLLILRRAAGVVQRLKPDIVHAPEYVSTAVLAVLGTRAPLVVTVPGNIFHRVAQGNPLGWGYTLFLKWAARTSARRCARIIAISAEMKRWWEWTGSPPAQTPMIPLGASAARFFPVEDAKVKLGLDPQRPLFVSVGRYSPEKGLLDLLEAVSLVRQPASAAGAQFVLIGRGAQRPALEARIRALGLGQLVELRDWVNPAELPTWYSAADALLLPSHSEGLSRTIPEAMACGTPVLASRITGSEDHVQDGLNGHLFPARDPAALAGVLRACLADPAALAQMRAATLAYFLAHLEWRAIMQRVVLEVYAPLLGGVPDALASGAGL